METTPAERVFAQDSRDDPASAGTAGQGEDAVLGARVADFGGSTRDRA